MRRWYCSRADLAHWLAYGGRSTGLDAEWRLEFYRGRQLVAERVVT